MSPLRNGVFFFLLGFRTLSISIDPQRGISFPPRIPHSYEMLACSTAFKANRATLGRTIYTLDS